MDYVDALAVWCVRQGVALPTYKEEQGCVKVTFLQKEYSSTPSGPMGAQCAAQEAYEKSGVFGKVFQSGFVPYVRSDKEFIVDLLHAPPHAAIDAVRAAPLNVQVTMFAPYNDRTTYPCSHEFTGASYTIYHTLHFGEEAFWSRLEWYLTTRYQTWVKNGTEVTIYSNVPYGDLIKKCLESQGVHVVLAC
jgi:hypothetical protein